MQPLCILRLRRWTLPLEPRSIELSTNDFICECEQTFELSGASGEQVVYSPLKCEIANLLAV